MRPLIGPLACGLGAAALLFGILCAAERRIPEPEDPWLDSWIGEGMKAEYRSTSTEPEQHLMWNEARDLFKSADFAGTTLRNYLVQNTSVQVVRLPKPDLAPFIKEGRAPDSRLKPQSNPMHVCRSGRLLLFVSAMGKSIPFVGTMKTPKRDVEQIFDVFEETAKRYP